MTLSRSLLALSLLLPASACIPGLTGKTDPPGDDVIVEPPFGGSGGGDCFDCGRGGGGPAPMFSAAVSSSKPVAPLSGGTLAILADGRTAVAADPDRNQIFITDLTALALRSTITLNDGDEPGRVVEGAIPGRVHVVLRHAGSIVTVDANTGTVLARRSVCAAPRGLAFETAKGQLHVACAEGEVVTLDEAPAGGVVRRVKLERDLRDVVVAGDTLMVSGFRAAKVWQIDGTGKVVRSVDAPGGISFGFKTRNGPAVMTPSVAWRLVPFGRSEALMVHQRGMNDEVEIQQGGYSGFGCGGIVDTAVTRFDAKGEFSTQSGVLPGAVLPVDIATSRDGLYAAVLSAGNAHMPQGVQSDTVRVGPVTGFFNGGDCNFMPPQPPPDRTGTGGTGGNTGGSTGGSGGNDGAMPTPIPEPIDFRLPPQGAEPVALAFDGLDRVVVQLREPAALFVTRGGAMIALSKESRLDTGYAVFHANSGGGLACASCHPEGGDDARTWKFAGLGPRRTQVLRGGVLDTAPFHWDGDLGSLDKLMGEVFVKRMSGPQLGAEHISTLGKWLNGIPNLPAAPASTPDAETAIARGQAVFNSSAAACTTCHNGAKLTNNASFDVGTGGKFQVPGLRGVGWRAPFMHNGCAKTLKDRFTGACGGGDAHGVTSKLTATQIDDLVAYLESL